MSMKRILGTMLASRMAGRGRPRGGLGAGSMFGGSGYRRRRGGMGGKMGLAALGYMAYRAYQDRQSGQSGQTGTTGHGTSASSVGSGRGSGGLGDMIRSVADQLTGGDSGTSSGGTDRDRTATGATDPDAPPEMEQDAAAADRIGDDTALLLIRAMITAAYSDGALSEDERRRIMQEIDDAGADPEERRAMEREIADPKPLDDLLAEVRDEETAQEFYLASRAAIEPDTEPHRAYLADLRRRLGLSDADTEEIEGLMA